MILEIPTKIGTYRYKQIELYYGRKIIDIDICRKNLLDFKKILDLEKLEFGIIYGTLLGAIRDKNFIEHDEDIDIFVLDENREKFLTLLFDLKKIGFEVARYDKNLLSIIKDNDYIDIYFFRRNSFGQRVCGSESIKASYLEKMDEMEFLNEKFKTPKNPVEFLIKAYGKDWSTPKKDTPGNLMGWDIKTKLFLKKYMSLKFINFLKQFTKR